MRMEAGLLEVCAGVESDEERVGIDCVTRGRQRPVKNMRGKGYEHLLMMKCRAIKIRFSGIVNQVIRQTPVATVVTPPVSKVYSTSASKTLFICENSWCRPRRRMTSDAVMKMSRTVEMARPVVKDQVNASTNAPKLLSWTLSISGRQRDERERGNLGYVQFCGRD